MKGENSKFSGYVFAQILILLSVPLFPSISSAALSSFMNLTCNGNEIQGEPSFTEIGGIDVSTNIEVLSFGANVSTPVDLSTGGRTGGHSYRPIRVLKRLDKSSPLILRALTTNELCDATIRFFRPNPNDGSTVHFYTIRLTGAIVSSIMPTQASVLEPSSASLPLLESVSFVFSEIEVTSEIDGTTHTDNWTTR